MFFLANLAKNQLLHQIILSKIQIFLLSCYNIIKIVSINQIHLLYCSKSQDELSYGRFPRKITKNLKFHLFQKLDPMEKNGWYHRI